MQKFLFGGDAEKPAGYRTARNLNAASTAGVFALVADVLLGRFERLDVKRQDLADMAGQGLRAASAHTAE
jgi:hypothetical protein